MFSDFEKGSKPNLPPCRWTWGCNKWALWASLVGISIFLSVSQFGTAAFLVNAGRKRGEQEQRNCRIRVHLTNGCPGRGFMSPPSQSRWSHRLTVTGHAGHVTSHLTARPGNKYHLAFGTLSQGTNQLESIMCTWLVHVQLNVYQKIAILKQLIWIRIQFIINEPVWRWH